MTNLLTSTPLRPAHLADLHAQTANDSCKLLGLPLQSSKGRRVHIAKVSGHVQLRQDFGARPLRDRKEMMELSPASTIKPLRNVRHHRDARPLNLVTEPEVFRKTPARTRLINITRQLPRSLPRNQILEPLNSSHVQTLKRPAAFSNSVLYPTRPSCLVPRHSPLCA